MNVSIFGLGYVGAVSLACLSRDGHNVFGVDIDKSKLALIKAGKSPIVESGIMELVAEVVASGRVDVTDSATQAIQDSDVSFVCVGTPSLPNGDQDLRAIERLSQEIGSALKNKSASHSIVIRSTVQPGTVEGRVIPIIEEHSGKKAGKDFSVCFQPEFLREGSSIKDYDNPPMTVVGAQDPAAFEPLRELFGHLPCKFIETDIRTAETLKYACNTFHALKISFANEIGRICQALGSDSHRVMDLLCEDKQLNISRAYLRPGFAFGGSCLPKDLRALLYMAKRDDVDVPMLAALLPSNRIHVERALEMVLAQGQRSVGVIGLSFKSGTDDLRESPMVTLVEQMIGKGLNLKIYDPEVRVSQLIGANKRYIDESIPHIGNLMCETIEDAFEDTQIVIVGLNDKEIIEKIRELNRPDQFMLDLVGLDKEGLRATCEGICW
jgi:GDP-mannose 6-dehydrogenase